MRKLICIICPNGCELSIDDNNNVTGNTCNRGKDFALQEIKEPKRTISSTIKTIFKDYPVVSVKVDNEIPKDKIFDVIKEINKVTLDKRLGINEVVIKNVCNLNCNIILTTNILKEEK